MNVWGNKPQLLPIVHSTWQYSRRYGLSLCFVSIYDKAVYNHAHSITNYCPDTGQIWDEKD